MLNAVLDRAAKTDGVLAAAYYKPPEMDIVEFAEGFVRKQCQYRIHKNKEAIQRVADAMLERDTVTRDDVRSLMK